MRCRLCGAIATEKHHIIFKSQGGTNNKENLLNICNKCHYQIHHGLNSKEYQKKSYEFIGELDKCWKGKIKPKQIILLENEKC